MTDAPIGELNAAVAAVDATLLESGLDAGLIGQLEKASAELISMRAEVDGGAAQDHAWLAQMVADQWDPSAHVTVAVLGAYQAFARWRLARSGDIRGH